MPTSKEDIEAFADALWEECSKQSEKIYSQQDLEALGIVEDLIDLARALQVLSNEKRTKLLTEGNDGPTSYQFRNAADVKIYQSLNFEEELVYARIDEAGADGIWTKIIKNRTGLDDTKTRSVFKSLEKRKLIRDMRNVEHPTRKMYIKAALKASERSTGGPWYTDNELDEGMIGELSDAIYRYIKNQTFHEASKSALKRRIASVKAVRALREKSFKSQIPIEADAEDDLTTKAKEQNDATYPFAASHQRYVTLDECTERVLDANVIKETILVHDDIQQILDLLCWDGKIEKVSVGKGVAYKAVRSGNDELTGEGPATGLTEAPCGRCPVFDLCEEGGPVSASNCQYFNRWLDAAF